MSYANVTSHYTPSEGQAHADPALLNTQSPTASNIADDTAKVGVVAPDFKKHPATETSEFQPKTVYTSKKSSKSPSKRTHRDFNSKEVADEAAHWAAVVKEVVLRPGVASGLVGVVNLGVIGYAGYTFYSEPHLRRSPQALSATVAGSVVLLGLEGFGAEKLRQEHGKDDAAVVARYFRQNPGMFQGLLGAVNVGIIGSTGYATYKNWDRWDKKTVGAITGALFTLWAGEGYLLAASKDS